MQKDSLPDKNTHNDEIDFPELFRTLWLNKKFILILTGIFAVLSVVTSLRLTNVYTSEALLAPTAQNNSKFAKFVTLNQFVPHLLRLSLDSRIYQPYSY